MIPCPSCGTCLAKRRLVGQSCACGYFRRAPVSGFFLYGSADGPAISYGFSEKSPFEGGLSEETVFEANTVFEGVLLREGEVREVPSEEVPDLVLRTASLLAVRKVMES